MSLTDSSRRAVGLCAALFILAGCGGSQTAAAPVRTALSVHPQISDKQTSDDLVYATSGTCGGICVFTYPKGTLKFKITVDGGAEGDCSDSAGNVFVTNNSQILEYAHGGTTPIATLTLPGINANSCAVDTATENLAVCGFGGNSGGNVAVYLNATGKPTVYDSNLGAMYCGYDNHGNLFVSGLLNGSSALSELPHGSSTFVPITLNGNPGGPGQVQWDGTYITLENLDNRNVSIARLRISGSAASVVSKTNLKNPNRAGQSWIVGNGVVLPYATKGASTNKIGTWRYPKNGKAVVKFGNFGQTNATTVIAVTVSHD